MPTPVKRRDKPYIWITWLTGLLAGSKQCRWAVWHRSHFHFNKTPEPDWTESNIKHTAIKNTLIRELELRDCEILPELKFKVDGKRGVLAGAIDTTAINGDRGMIFEIKSGARRDSNLAQLMIYMWALPKSSKRFQDILFDGMLVYEDERVTIPASKIDDAFKATLKDLIVNILTDEPPRKYPSVDECRFCNVADCDERRSELEVEEPSAQLPDFL